MRLAAHGHVQYKQLRRHIDTAMNKLFDIQDGYQELKRMIDAEVANLGGEGSDVQGSASEVSDNVTMSPGSAVSETF